MNAWILSPLLLCLLTTVSCDTPVNCTFDDIKGTWIFYESERNQGPDINCNPMGDPVHKKRVSLFYPNVAVDDYGNKGTWTMVYDQGFEVRVAGRSYFAFSEFIKHDNNTVESICGKTKVGWSRDITVRNWACYKGLKVDEVESKFEDVSTEPQTLESYYTNDDEFISAINDVQKNWTAKAYPEYETMTLRDMNRRAGGQRLRSRVRPAKPSALTRLRAMILPDDFDWRNVSGNNYVAPVRDQGKCGSCYAFASMAGLEARVRIMTLNNQKPVFSPQDILDCSELSQGCQGGFAYLIAGRYGQDKGVVLEECKPYSPSTSGVCTTSKSCIRHYTAFYRYTGGYFGACNEEEMKIALVKGGPLMVGLEVYEDLMHYAGGIYHHVTEVEELDYRFNPLEETNHAVLLVGYGVEPETKEKFWIVKNSWGEKWGESGYFRIRRGTDECAIESMAFEVVPIPA